MRKSKNNDKTWLNPFWVVIFGLVLGIAVTLASFWIFPDPEPSINWARARTFLSIVTIPLVLTGFYYTTIQFQKALAKPKLELFFTNTKNAETSIKIRPVEEDKQSLEISVLNQGTAIIDMFQISYYINKIFNPTIDYYNEGNEDLYDSRPDGDNVIVSFINKHKYVCFVDMPTTIRPIILHIYKREYSNIMNELVIPYKIYGYWGKPQEGKLRVIINKQEVPHA
jgi:hypothetical protein